MPHIRRVASISAVLGLLILSGTRVPLSLNRASQQPRLVLWAWERPEDLRFLPSKRIRVAFLAGSVYLDAQPVLRPRQQLLRVAEETPVTAVVRLEITPNTPTVFTEGYRSKVMQQILRLVALPRVSALQLDFDATRSQRDFYRALLRDIRHGMPTAMPLSITALGSWCLGDDWLGALPIDDAVPMMFRIGPDGADIVRWIHSGQDFREPLCRHSVGISTDEPWPAALLDRTVYVFNPQAWDRTTLAAVERGLQP